MKKKRLAAALCAVMMVFTCFAGTAMAVVNTQNRSPASQRGIAIVNEANRQIEECVRQAQQSSFPFDSLVIASTVIKTEIIAKTAILRAGIYGVKAVCVYEYVNIRGHQVLIDPLKVVSV